MAKPTKERLIEAARRLFSERGFEGVSIADIADELSITKQALLYHFGRKEALYGAVLQSISESFLNRIDALTTQDEDPAHQIEALFVSLYKDGRKNQEGLRLVMRELLDNAGRTENAKDWYLKPYLDRTVSLMRKAPGASSKSDAEIFAFIYQVIGASSYMNISTPTLSAMYGKQVYGAIDDAWLPVLQKQIEGFLHS